MERFKLRDRVCPQQLIIEAQAAFVSLFGSMRKKGSSENLGPVKRARISPAENTFRVSRRSSNKMAWHLFKKMSKPQRRREWNKSADVFVTNTECTENTIFGIGVAGPCRAWPDPVTESHDGQAKCCR